MKILLLATSLLLTINFFMFGQSISPMIISVAKSKIKNTHNVVGESYTIHPELAEVLVLAKPKSRWLIPFTQSDTALAMAYDKDGNKFAGVSTATIRPSLNGSNTNSVYVEFTSYVVSTLFRISLGSNLVQNDLRDSSKSAQNIAFQKLTNGGGNLVLSLSRPLIFIRNFATSKNGFFVVNLDVTGYSDIEALNKDVYNPGWGAFLNLGFDLRLVNSKANISTGQEGNLFRFGLNGKIQNNFFNEKYQTKNNLDKIFNNLNILSTGLYFGLAMFNVQFSYNSYIPSSSFFDEKKWLLRIEVVPVKF